MQQNSTTKIIITVTDEQSGAIVDISSSTSVTLKIQRPDGSELTGLQMNFVTNGTDGAAYYVCQETDLNLPGMYQFQPFYSFGQNYYPGSISQQQIYGNL